MVSERKEIFGVLLLVVAIAALFSGIHTYRYNLRVKSFEFAAGHWPIVEARVLDLNGSARRAGLTYRPVVCYIFNGIRFTATLDSVNPQVWRDAFARSERVQIYVNPDSPTDAMAASDAVNQYHCRERRAGGQAGAFFGFLFVVTLYITVRSSGRRKAAAAAEEAVEGP